MLGAPTVNHIPHIQSDVFVNHGLVCFVEKYVLHLSFVPHTKLLTVVHVDEHDDVLFPLLLPSSHASFPFFTPSQHRVCVAEHDLLVDPFLHFHVYVLGVPE
jgi:hypothetical protein